ncbi:unnamed protein product, partial [Symbiodinium microadriaticum]
MEPAAVSTAIRQVGREGEWKVAGPLLARLRQSSAEADVVVYNATSTACGLVRRWQQAMGWLSRQRPSQLRPSAVSLGALLSACERSSSWQ